MAMETNIETAAGSANAYACTGASEAGPAHHIMARKHSNDIGNGNKTGGGRNHAGKGPKTNNSVVDILDLAVPQSKVRPIDRLLDRYDWSSASMATPLFQDTWRAQYDQPLSRPGQPTPSPLPPTPPTRPRLASEFSDRKRPVRKSLWKRAKELVSSFFVRAFAAGP